MASISKAVKRNRDEYFTPPILANVIVPFLKNMKPKGKKLNVLCPFDTEEGSFYAALSSFCDVQCAHLMKGRVVKDFFTWRLDELAEYDVIVSNIPFSRKLEIFERLYVIGIPFAVICNLMCLNYEIIGRFFS
jgi:hypothetical protein